MQQIAAIAGLVDSQRWLKAARWLVDEKTNYDNRNRPWQPRKGPGIESGAVGAGNSVAAPFNALPQLAAEAEGSGGAKGRQGAGDGVN